MAALAPQPGGNPAGARASIEGEACVPDTVETLRLQTLLARHHVHPALAPIVAALAWAETRA